MSEQTEIREIHEADAEAFLDLLTRVDAETDFMLLEAGERATTVVEQRERIKGILSKESPLHCVGKLGEIPWHRASRADGADGQREGDGTVPEDGV
jgi:hypothetical protein